MAAEMNKQALLPSWRHDNERDSVISNSELIGYYSCDRLKTYLPDSSRLTYYESDDRREDVYFDLNEGLESAIPRNYSSGDRRLLFKWIKLNSDAIKAPPNTDRWIEPNFVCTGGLLGHLLCGYYSTNERWSIRAAKWKGTIYLAFGRKTTVGPRFYEQSRIEYPQYRGSRETIPTLSQIPSTEFAIFNPRDGGEFSMVSNNVESRFDYNRKPRGYYLPPSMIKKYASWLHKFVQYIVSDSPDEAPDTSRPVSEPDEFRCVYKIRFGEFSILFDASMHGVLSKKKLADPLPMDELKFINVKLNKNIESEKQERSFRRFKQLKWWSVGYLTNTEEFLCGFRNDEGIVRKVQKFNLHEMVEEAKNEWRPRTCIDYCESFLKKIAEAVVNDCVETIYEFEKVPYREELRISEMPSTEKTTIIPAYFLEETL